MGRKGATLIETKFKQLLLLLLIWTQVSWLGVAQSKDSSAAPSLLLANELGPNVDPAKYLISEKYDGVRAIWDGKMLRFRSGRSWLRWSNFTWPIVSHSNGSWMKWCAAAAKG